jgi:hypothetical protein
MQATPRHAEEQRKIVEQTLRQVAALGKRNELHVAPPVAPHVAQELQQAVAPHVAPHAQELQQAVAPHVAPHAQELQQAVAPHVAQELQQAVAPKRDEGSLCVYACNSTGKCMYVWLTKTHTCTFACMHVLIHNTHTIHVYMQVCTYNIYIYIYIYTHTHIHTHRQHLRRPYTTRLRRPRRLGKKISPRPKNGGKTYRGKFDTHGAAERCST